MRAPTHICRIHWDFQKTHYFRCGHEERTLVARWIESQQTVRIEQVGGGCDMRELAERGMITRCKMKRVYITYLGRTRSASSVRGHGVDLL